MAARLECRQKPVNKKNGQTKEVFWAALPCRKTPAAHVTVGIQQKKFALQLFA